MEDGIQIRDTTHFQMDGQGRQKEICRVCEELFRPGPSRLKAGEG